MHPPVGHGVITARSSFDKWQSTLVWWETEKHVFSNTKKNLKMSDHTAMTTHQKSFRHNIILLVFLYLLELKSLNAKKLRDHHHHHHELEGESRSIIMKLNVLVKMFSRWVLNTFNAQIQRENDCEFT